LREAPETGAPAGGPGPSAPPPSDPGRPVWKRNLLVLIGAQTLAVSAMGIIIPLIPFFVRELGTVDRAAVERWSGLIFSGPFLAAALMSPVWGFVGDKYGHKMVVVRAVAGLAVVNFLLTWVQSPLQFYVLRLLQGAVTGFIPAALAITSASTPSEKLPDALGKLYASASAGRLIGPAAGGILAGFLGFREIFVLVGAIISVAAVVVVVYLKDPPRAAGAREASALGNVRYVLGDGRTRLGMAGLLLGMSAISMAMPIFPLYVEDLVLDEGRNATVWTGIGFAVVAGATLLASTFLGRIADRLGLKIVLLLALGVSSVALALHPFAADLPQMLALRALLGIGAAGIAPTLHTMINRKAPEEIRGGIAGFASSATIFGFFLGPMSGGWLANRLGVGGVFEVAAVLLLVCAIGAAVIAKRQGTGRTIVPVPDQMPR
jgi:DHA1 family multidrug resistance protein-like MFS transporter